MKKFFEFVKSLIFRESKEVKEETIKKVRVEQFEVKNQFLIYTDDGESVFDLYR